MTKLDAGKTPRRSRPRTVRATTPSEPARVHPRSVPIIVPESDVDQAPDQPFAEGAHEEIDSELRYRMISEAAYRRYVERSYADGGDVDDWLQAEAEVDHLLLNRGAARS